MLAISPAYSILEPSKQFRLDQLTKRANTMKNYASEVLAHVALPSNKDGTKTPNHADAESTLKKVENLEITLDDLFCLGAGRLIEAGDKCLGVLADSKEGGATRKILNCIKAGIGAVHSPEKESEKLSESEKFLQETKKAWLLENQEKILEKELNKKAWMTPEVKEQLEILKQKEQSLNNLISLLGKHFENVIIQNSGLRIARIEVPASDMATLQAEKARLKETFLSLGFIENDSWILSDANIPTNPQFQLKNIVETVKDGTSTFVIPKGIRIFVQATEIF